MPLNDQVNVYIYGFLADFLFFEHIQVNRLDFNAWKCWQTCHYIELSEYKLYMGHIHTLVLTREWIAMLRKILSCDGVFNEIVRPIARHAQLNRHSR